MDSPSAANACQSSILDQNYVKYFEGHLTSNDVVNYTHIPLNAKCSLDVGLHDRLVSLLNWTEVIIG